ncbi:hypothetical protein JJB07_12265 [Tumebacillus sp. ITR2]|uniref:DUF4179 domain-containing protein n=1 Tax=Tumebacillus amylolyticus TaxID=2801339 RepID=A0ABS1JAY5_9BACL|nr:hypothetical protein [Tumebacillus amylolyticus]MBL0387428.1 hypothetical protein [Tumebacillus amylolyticus]
MSMRWSDQEPKVVEDLQELSPFHLSQEERHEMWQNIRRRVPKQKSRQRNRRFTAAGVVAAACAVLVVGAVQSDWLPVGNQASLPKHATGQPVDFQVGFDALYEVQGAPTTEGLQATVATLQNRLDQTGVKRGVVTIVDPSHVRVQTTGEVDAEALRALLTQTAKVEFKSEDGTVLATGTDLQSNATAMIDPQTKLPQVQIEFKNPALFKTITEKNIGHRLSIWLDNHMVANPMIQTSIADGKAVINGFKDEADAKKSTALINNAVLPYPLLEQSVTTTGN